MKLTIEVVADTRHEAERILRDAVTAVRRGNERSGVEVNSCLGDYRITVEDEVEPEPFEVGARVVCLDEESVYFGFTGTVEHSGPRATGVRWDGWSGPAAKCTKMNAFLKLAPEQSGGAEPEGQG